MKISSTGFSNLCSTENDSFKTANNSSSVAFVCREKFNQSTGWRGNLSACLESTGNLLVAGLMDKTSCSHKWPHGFCCILGCVRFHLDSPSWRRDLWLVWSHEGKGSYLISRLIHIPSQLRRIEVSMWRVIINTRAVSPSHESSRTLHNYTANEGSSQTCWEEARSSLAKALNSYLLVS